MILTWEGIKGVIDAAKTLATSAAKLGSAKENAEAATKINDLINLTQELWNKVFNLEAENRELRSKLELQAQLERNPKGYYTEKGTNRKICGLCWERNKRLITLLETKNSGFAMGSDRGGFSSWTELMRCPDCKTEYDHQSKSENW